MSKFIREMQENRAAVIAKMTSLNQLAAKEDRAFTNFSKWLLSFIGLTQG